MPPYGQIIIGPPGSGKSTYCNGMNQFLNSIGRNSLIINLDPANDRLPYACTLDIRDVITLEEIMNDEQLGPNGGLMHCLEIFDESIDFFIDKIRELIKLSLDEQSTYVIFDCPGQTELFTNSPVFKSIFQKLIKELDFRMCVVSLVDSINLTIPSHWIAFLLLTLRSMLQLDLPQINVISKIDLLNGYIQSDKLNRIEEKKRKANFIHDHDEYNELCTHDHSKDDDDIDVGGLPFKLQYYTDVEDLHFLTPYIKKENNQRSHAWFNEKYSKLTESIADLIDDFGLLSFNVLAIEDKTSMINLLSIIDKANGYCFGTNELGGDSIWTDAVRQSGMGFMEDIDIQERWIDEKEQWDALEEEKHKELLEYYEKHEKPYDPEAEWEESLREWEANNKKSFTK